MMKTNKSLDIFIPKKFVIGLDDDNVGFPSMKNDNGKWTNASIFEKHCKYKPNTQRDARVEINKVLTQKVQEVENVPTAGFKLVNVYENKYCSDLYKNIKCVTLRDPRGWDISIDRYVFQKLLECNGFNMKNGELTGIELMYAWNNNIYSPFSLVAADNKTKKIQELTDKCLNVKSYNSIKPSKFKIGKVYSSSLPNTDGHKYMYLGKHNVYSAQLIEYALDRGKYENLKIFIDNRTDITGEKYVFYCIDADRKNNFYMTYNTRGCTPYYVTRNISKLFDKCEDVDLAAYTMHNDFSKQCTYQNICEDMATSPMFNMIDFSKTYRISADYQTIEVVCHNENSIEEALKAFPFYNDCRNIEFMRNSSFGKITKGFSIVDASTSSQSAYSVVESRHHWYNEFTFNTYKYNAHTTNSSMQSENAAIMQLMHDYEPTLLQYVLCNGKKVSKRLNMCLNKRNAR